MNVVQISLKRLSDSRAMTLHCARHRDTYFSLKKRLGGSHGWRETFTLNIYFCSGSLFLHVCHSTINFPIIQAYVLDLYPGRFKILVMQSPRRWRTQPACVQPIINARGVLQIYIWVKPCQFGATISFVLFRGNLNNTRARTARSCVRYVIISHTPEFPGTEWRTI